MTTTDRLGIDDVLRAFGSDNHGTLRLEAGLPARILGVDGTTRDLSSRPLTRQEILSLVSPVVPEHARRLLPKEPSVTFDYPSSVGVFTLTVTSWSWTRSCSKLPLRTLRRISPYRVLAVSRGRNMRSAAAFVLSWVTSVCSTLLPMGSITPTTW